MLLNVPAAVLACSVLFNTSSLHFFKFVKMDPKYLNVTVPSTSILSLIFIFCLSLPIPRHSALKIFTFVPHL